MNVQLPSNTRERVKFQTGRNLHLLSIVLSLSTGISAYSEASSNRSDLENLIAEVRENDPAIEASRLRWEALQKSAVAAGELPDPNLTLGYFVSSVETRVGPMDSRLNLSQKIPYPGKLQLAEDQALTQAEISRWQYLRLLRDRATRVKVLYADLYRIDSVRSLIQDQINLVGERIETLRRQYESGQSELTEIHLAHQHLAEMENRIIGLDGQRNETTAEINRLRNITLENGYPAVSHLPESRLPDQQLLVTLAEQNSEWIKAENAAVEAADFALKLANKERYPDFTVGVDYTEVGRNRFASPSDNGSDAAMAYVSINLPFWGSKYDAREEGSRSLLEAARTKRLSTLLDLRSSIIRHHARASAFAGQLKLYREELLPQAESRYQATLASYSAGETTALHWIESQRDLLQAQTGLPLIQAEYFSTISELEGLVAVEFHAF